MTFPPITLRDAPKENHIHDGFNEDIQIMRAVAILAVLAYHFSLLSTLVSRFHAKFGMPEFSIPFYSGVDLFFVISGFVVMRSLSRGGFDPAVFGIRRVLRLYPPLLVFLMGALVLNEFYRHVAGIEWAKGFFTVTEGYFCHQAAAVLGGYFINVQNVWSYSFGALWSLSVEFQFYAAIFLLMVILRSLRVRIELIQQIFFGSALVVVGYCVYARLGTLFRPPPFFESYLISERFDFMAMGAILAFLPQETLRRWCARTRYWAPLVPLVIGWIALMFFRTPEAPARPNDGLMGIGLLISLITFTIAIALTVGGEKNKSLPAKLRSALLYIGDRSYAIYLFHFPVMAFVWYLIYKLFPAWMANALFYSVLQAVFSFILVLVLSELTSRFVEIPAIAWSARLVKRLRELRVKPVVELIVAKSAVE